MVGAKSSRLAKFAELIFFANWKFSDEFKNS